MSQNQNSEPESNWVEDLFGFTKTYDTTGNKQSHQLSRGHEAQANNPDSDYPHRYDIQRPDGKTQTHYSYQNQNGDVSHIRYKDNGYDGMRDQYNDATGDDA